MRREDEAVEEDEEDEAEGAFFSSSSTLGETVSLIAAMRWACAMELKNQLQRIRVGGEQGSRTLCLTTPPANVWRVMDGGDECEDV